MENNRLIWACRRGMLELDLILQPFLADRYPNLAAADQLRFQTLLACEDQDLFGWLLGHRDPDDPDLCEITALIRRHSGLSR